MKIGIDARMYGPRQGGLGRYIEQLILHLEKLNTNDEFVVFLRKDNWHDYSPSAPNFRKVLADVPWYGLAEQIKLSKIIAKEKVDLMHFPHWNVPLFYSAPFVVTIHDLLLLHYPTRRASTLGFFTYWLKNLAFRFVLRHAVKKSRHIFTVSEFSKQDIVATLHIPPEKITVTYPAPTPNTISSLPATSYQLPAGLTLPYILYVGVAYPHKNLDGLLRAWKIFTTKHGDKYQLVLAGKDNYFYNHLQATSYQLQAQNVLLTGFIPDSDLPALYTNASLFIMPSLYEGFGLPPLEALSAGIPVAASNRTCLPEVLGSAAIYFDPDDHQAIADAIFTGLTNQKTRENVLAAAPDLLSRYSWKTLAQKTWEEYKNSV